MGVPSHDERDFGFAQKYDLPITRVIKGIDCDDTLPFVEHSGVLVNSGEFCMEGGSITNNTANNGGGVFINGGSFLGDGGNVSGNNAPTDPEIGSATGSSQTVYSVTINAVGNGTVTANVDAAFEDDEIALNISPDENHLLSEISATCADADDAEKANLTIVDGDGEGNDE